MAPLRHQEPLAIRLRLSLPSVQATLPEGRPTRCPAESCLSQTFRRFGKPKKAVRDLSVREVRAQRWQCTECGATFRLYPTGVSRRHGRLNMPFSCAILIDMLSTV